MLRVRHVVMMTVLFVVWTLLFSSMWTFDIRVWPEYGFYLIVCVAIGFFGPMLADIITSRHR